MTAGMRRHRTRRAFCAVVASSLIGTLAACGSPSDAGDDDGPLVVWTLENLPERLLATRAVIERFTAETGIDVRLVAVDEQQVPALIQSAVLSGEMPDVIGALPLSYVRQLDSLNLLDTETAGAVMDRLGPETFDESAIQLTTEGDRHLSVPSDAWSQILVYRKDLFEQAGLEPPTTFDAIAEAARTLDGEGRFGMTLATDPADVFTSQTFEALALGNGCELVDDDGAVTLDSPECAETWDLYGELATERSPRGTQTVDSTRATYFSGDAAMVLWSTFILDELAGLRNDALPTCDECADDPEWLARNSGIVTSISGPGNADGATFGEIVSWAVLRDADAEASEQLVEFMLSDGYLDWLAMAPEGKFPVRRGDAEEPERFTQEWARLEAGVDTKRPLSDIYDARTIEALTAVGSEIDRWAIPQGHGSLIGPVGAQLPIPRAVSELAAGGLTTRDAEEQAQRDVTTISEVLDR